MRLTDILKPQCIRVPLNADNKKDAIFEIVDLLGDAGLVADVQKVKDAVWHRESTRTTGIGHGLAIPHGKCDVVDGLTMAIGKPAKPIEFNSIDGRPVNVIILLVSAADQTGPHIQALATISRMMTNESFRNAVRLADSSEALYKLIEDHEAAATQG